MNHIIKKFLTSALLSAGGFGTFGAATEAVAYEGGSFAECSAINYNDGRIYTCRGDYSQASLGMVYTVGGSGASATMCEYVIARKEYVCGSYVTIQTDGYTPTSVPQPTTRGFFPEIHVTMPNRTTAKLIGYAILD